ncbi:helicase ARIP4 [Austrofundulus limnaeus]|uniref:Helicase ARIP4-like n=1 Tax=Austrofundulus limnaeus TaxID=52670 RepID=A0A2I4D143_AUSLI|nr:PREDICTED: helicase ARIP4-like [Austrofundulus limnaeus]XP_013885943.1 PREDICTED: helicase ARIP4-like [Austrofundulus limnaeus]
MSEEAISESDLEASPESEVEFMENEEEEDNEENEDMDVDEDENDGDDEDDDQPASAQSRTDGTQDGGDSSSVSSEDPSSRPPSQPASRPSSRTSSRPESGSQAAASPENSSQRKPPSSKTKKQKSSKLPKSSKSSKGSKPSKPSKPAHMRKNIRKLLKEDQLEAGTKAAQQEEMERRKRLEQQRKEFPMPASVLPDSQLVETAALLAEVSHLVPAVPSDVICLDSSGEEDEKLESNLPALAIRNDVIELSSGDEDALQISSESADEDAEGATGSEESSGAHINDALNLPDAQGQVLVNINHPPEEKDIYLAPQLARAVKPHQVGGIRFLYDNLIESLERYKTSSGFGCILAHSMGLGKTLQVISFIDILLKNTEARTVLAIVPVNTLQNWLSEFNLWLPPQDSLPPDTDPTLVTGRTFKVHILNDEHKTTVARAKVVEEWSRDGGVLLMGYEMYRLLSMKKSFVMGKKRKTKKPVGPVIIDLDEEDRQQELMKGIEKAIVRPGPDVVICDEGHRIKNYHASTSQALKSIRSRRRVVLTGYPLQNNLIEYWCMVDFVRPDFLGTRQEFSNMFERPILNGQCMDSTPQDVRLMRYRSHVLYSLLEGFVQRRGHDVLRHHLPSKEEFVILVRLSPVQKALYTEFMKRFREAGNSGWLGLNPLKAFCVCCKIWNHPDVLYEALQKENQANEQDLDLDDITSASNPRCPAPSTGLKAKVPDPSNSKVNNSLPLVNISQDRANQVITYEWAKDIMSNYQIGVLENSAKMVLLFHLIDESVKRRDKVLVFSQSLSTLTVLEDFLSKRPMPGGIATTDGQNPNWVRNLNYYRLDGSTSASERERLINQFNDPENTTTWVFLLSTRAGCLGVNLIGASRVIVFDASWNPCHDAQAVCRVYRYGQRKPCYIYRLVCDFTLEKKIYDRQVSKQGMSDRVVDDLNPVLNFTRKEVESLLHFVEEEPEAEKLLMESQDLESVIRQACQLYPNLITKPPFHHESLLVDRKESKLTKAEKRAAKKSYEDEKRASVPYSRPSYVPYYPTSDHTLASIAAFNQRGWRPLTRPDDKPVASVRPIQSTPIPMMPRQVGMGMSGFSSAGNLPLNFLQKAGVYVQRIVTTTDIVIPGPNGSSEIQAHIPIGESIHIIRGSKGTYIRTNDGRIFAIRSGKNSRSVIGTSASSRGSQSSSIQRVSNGCSSPVDQQQRSPNSDQQPSSPSSSEILRELSNYTSSAGDASSGAGNEPSLPSDVSSVPAGDEGSSQTSDLRREVSDELLSSALEVRGKKRKHNDNQGSNAQTGGKHTSAAAHFPSLPLGSSGLSFPPVSLNSSSLLGNLSHMSQPLLMAGGGSSFLQPPGQTMADLQSMFPSAGADLLRQPAIGNGHLPTPSSSSAFSSASTTVPMSSSPSAGTSSSLPSAPLPPYLMNQNMAGLLSPNFSVGYGQPLLSAPRMFPNTLLPGTGGFSTPNSNSATPGFLSHFNNPTSSLLGAALAQPDRYPSSVNGGDSSDDDVIEVTGQ